MFLILFPIKTSIFVVKTGNNAPIVVRHFVFEFGSKKWYISEKKNNLT